MRTYNYFVVELDKLINDKLTLKSGLELHIDHRFNDNGEFENRVTEGPVVAAPFKIDSGVEPGDTLYFHHLVVMQGGQVLTGMDNHYIVKCSKEAINNQAIAYKSKKDGKIRPLFGWSLLEPVEEDDDLKSDVIDVVQLKEKLPTKGRVAFDSEELEEIGVSVGDVVGFKENRDYRITIDGKEYYRTRVQDLLYAEVYND
jgi:co-chaperonin GroES (HSP10)